MGPPAQRVRSFDDAMSLSLSVGRPTATAAASNARRTSNYQLKSPLFRSARRLGTSGGGSGEKAESGAGRPLSRNNSSNSVSSICSADSLDLDPSVAPSS